jgi:transcription initiation factor TFIIIB Brf1 subunit/transcription initiation factor TFIIB
MHLSIIRIFIILQYMTSTWKCNNCRNVNYIDFKYCANCKKGIYASLVEEPLQVQPSLPIDRTEHSTTQSSSRMRVAEPSSGIIHRVVHDAVNDYSRKTHNTKYTVKNMKKSTYVKICTICKSDKIKTDSEQYRRDNICGNCGLPTSIIEIFSEDYNRGIYRIVDREIVNPVMIKVCNLCNCADIDKSGSLWDSVI